MIKFGNRGLSLLNEPKNWLGRLAMWAVSAFSVTLPGGIATRVYFALFIGAFDGWLRWWNSCTARSFVVRPAGIEVRSMFNVRLVPWECVSAIQTWHYINYTDYVAIHYRCAEGLKVATCSAYYPEEELRQFVGVCASRVPQPASIVIAGLGERGVWSRLLRRLIADAVVAGLVGLVIGAARPVFLFGLVAASSSTLVAAVRYPIRTSTLVQRDGLWAWETPRRRPLRTIPRALRYWVRGLEESAYRAHSRS